MQTRIKQRLLGYAWGVITPVVCTIVNWPLHPLLGQASVLMTYLLGVFLVASRYGRGASITASLLSAPAFAFYFASPIFSFAIGDIENIVGLAIMIVVANVTSNLLDQWRLQVRLAQQRENRTNALYQLSLDLADANSEQDVALVTQKHVYQQFTAPNILLFITPEGVFCYPNTKDYFAQYVDTNVALQAAQSSTVINAQGMSYYPLKYAQAIRAVMLIESTKMLVDDRAVSAFFDAVRNLIIQSLERLYLARQAKKAQVQAETESLRNALLSAISHDLRTPLTRINSAASNLLEDDINQDEKQEIGKIIVEEAQRMSDLTSKILDMARLSSGEIVLHQDWNTIEEIVGSALTRLDSRLRDRPVRTQLSAKLPLVWVDAVLMQQVLVNLLENAIKYTPAGSPIDISSQLIDNQIEIIISDYGQGIPLGMEEKLFEKFFRLETESDQSGVGLGLALCRAIVKAHNGFISAKNLSSSRGAAFVITLPKHLPPAINE